jgi:hypothetical protein
MLILPNVSSAHLAVWLQLKRMFNLIIGLPKIQSSIWFYVIIIYYRRWREYVQDRFYLIAYGKPAHIHRPYAHKKSV